jgi:hypothetical protein
MTLKALVNLVENNKIFTVDQMSLVKFEGGENYSDNSTRKI